MKKSFTTTILLLSTFLFTFSIGINSVSFPLILYKKQISPLIIGIIEAIEILSGILIAKFLFVLSKKFGVFKIITISSLAEALIISILPFYFGISWWIFLVFISGFCWFAVIALRQSWINLSINDKQRSFILSLNSTMMCAGFALGPCVVKFFGAGNYQSLVISSVLVLFSCFALFLIKEQEPRLEQNLTENKVDYWQIIKKYKKIFTARFLLDLQSTVIILFTVIYGIKKGLTAENAGILVSAFMLVGLLDIIIGAMIKNRRPERYIKIGFFGNFISMLFLPFVVNLHYFLAISIFIICGWFASLIFIAIGTEMNNGQDQNNSIILNSTLQAIGGLGALSGTVLVGVFMQIFDANGFIILIVLANLLYLLISFFYKTIDNLS